MKLKLTLITSLFFLINTSSSGQELSMFRGTWSMQYYKDDARISKKDFGNYISQDSEREALWKESNKSLAWAWGAVGAQFGMLAWQIIRRNNGDSQTLPLMANIGFGVTAIYLGARCINLRKEAILSYNANLDKTTIMEYGVTPHGLGLVMSF